MNRTIIAIVVTLLVVLGIYRFGFSKGWGERDAEMQAEIAHKNEEARAKEHELGRQLNDKDLKLKEANHAIDQKQSALDRAIRAGRVRLPATSCVPAAAGTAASSVDRVETATESERETLRLIAEIAADGDRAIVQLNACIDAYNQVMETINGKR